MENTDYKAAIKACMEIESGDDVLDFYENHGTAIFRALRFAEKMTNPSEAMHEAGGDVIRKGELPLEGEQRLSVHGWGAYHCLKSMRDQALKELGE